MSMNVVKLTILCSRVFLLESCKLLLHSGSDYWTTVEGTRHAINTSVEIPSNTRVYIGCHDGYEERLTSGEPVPEDNKYSVCAKGEWTPIYQCKLSMILTVSCIKWMGILQGNCNQNCHFGGASSVSCIANFV